MKFTRSKLTVSQWFHAVIIGNVLSSSQKMNSRFHMNTWFNIPQNGNLKALTFLKQPIKLAASEGSKYRPYLKI
jgi:uncharacterized protein with NRDE domain